MANSEGHFIAWKNVIEADDVTFETAVEDQGDRVALNLKTTESDDAWRFPVATGATSATVTAVLTADKTIELLTTQFPRFEYPGVSEDMPNIATTDTIRYRLLDSADVELHDSTVLTASDVLPGYMFHYYRPSSPVSGVRKIELTVDAVSRETLDDAFKFCDVGYLGAWEQLLEPDVGYAYPAGFGWPPRNENARTATGRLYSARFEPYRKWSLALDFLSNAESLNVDEMIRYTGGGRQMMVRRGDLPAGKDGMLAIVTTPRDMESRTGTIRQQSFTFNEFI